MYDVSDQRAAASQVSRWCYDSIGMIARPIAEA